MADLRRPSNRSVNEDSRGNGAVARASRRQVAGKTGRANGQPSELSGRKRAGGSSGISTNQMIGIGVGVLAVLLIGFLAFSNRGGDKQENRARKTVEAVKDEGESTPCPQLVKLAEQSLANGDKSRAVNYYSRAANRAEQDGNTNQALQYSMKAKQLMFTSKLKDR